MLNLIILSFFIKRYFYKRHIFYLYRFRILMIRNISLLFELIIHEAFIFFMHEIYSVEMFQNLIFLLCIKFLQLFEASKALGIYFRLKKCHNVPFAI